MGLPKEESLSVALISFAQLPAEPETQGQRLLLPKPPEPKLSCKPSGGDSDRVGGDNETAAREFLFRDLLTFTENHGYRDNILPCPGGELQLVSPP